MGEKQLLKKIRPARGTLFALCFFAGGLVACGAAALPQMPLGPSFDITVPGAADDVTMTTSGDAAFIEVRSERGIGEAGVALRRGLWPANLALRLHLKGLEGLQVAYGDTKLALSVNTSGQVLQSASTADEGEIATAVGSPYWMDVVVQESDAGRVYVVTLPADFFAATPATLDFSWIDFYR